MPTHKTSAWPLALVCVGLICYASLYPFAHWRDQGVPPWLFVWAPFPKYWTGFDVVSNVVGYLPLGFFLALNTLRTGRHHAVWWATLAGAVLSFAMEALQVYLPDRVPSNLDWWLNVSGTVVGATAAWGLERLGVLVRWSRFRDDWFVPEARGGLVLLALWPVALLFPSVVPFGLGQVLERLMESLASALVGTPFLAWLPAPEPLFQPFRPIGEWLSVCLGVWIPCLLGYCVIVQPRKRLWLVLWVLAFGLTSTALSAALSFGPEHTWVWLNSSVKAALLWAMVMSLVLIWVPRRASAALAVLALGVSLSLINQASVDPYFEQTLFSWEQGQFIRFHGLAQWLGWLWPFATLVYVLSLLWGKEEQP